MAAAFGWLPPVAGALTEEVIGADDQHGFLGHDRPRCAGPSLGLFGAPTYVLHDGLASRLINVDTAVGARCICRRWEKVVDLWVGIHNGATIEGLSRITPAIARSACYKALQSLSEF